MHRQAIAPKIKVGRYFTLGKTTQGLAKFYVRRGPEGDHRWSQPQNLRWAWRTLPGLWWIVRIYLQYIKRCKNSASEYPTLGRIPRSNISRFSLPSRNRSLPIFGRVLTSDEMWVLKSTQNCTREPCDSRPPLHPRKICIRWISQEIAHC